MTTLQAPRARPTPASARAFTPVRGGVLQRKCACGGTPGPSGECEECRKKKLQRKARNSESGTQNDLSVPPIVHEVLRSPGQPLDAQTRAYMEPRFGHDFSRVRIHAESTAAASTRAVNAIAYTSGSQVVFNAGRYAPHTSEGRKLLAHELTHVIQQNKADVSSGSQIVSATDPSEREAETVSERVSSGAKAGVTTTMPTRGVQRLAGPEVPVSPQAIEEMHALLRQFMTLSESGAVTATEAAEVSTAVAEAEAALVTATETIAAGSTAVTVGETTLVASGALAADDVTGIGVADDIAIPFLLVGAAVAFGVGFLIGSSVEKIAAASQRAIDAMNKAVEALKKAVSKAKTQPQPEPQPQPQSIQTDTTGKRRKRSCRTNEPCEEPLPISWPNELPTPEGVSPRTLRRTAQGDLEWEGVERGNAQRAFAEELRQFRERNLPLPEGVTCFSEDAEPNVPLDAHHIHPMYLNGEDASWNLCGLETLRHHRGHTRLDNQTPFLPIYVECGICSPFLKDHPGGQLYTIVSSK